MEPEITLPLVGTFEIEGATEHSPASPSPSPSQPLQPQNENQHQPPLPNEQQQNDQEKQGRGWRRRGCCRGCCSVEVLGSVAIGVVVLLCVPAVLVAMLSRGAASSNILLVTSSIFVAVSSFVRSFASFVSRRREGSECHLCLGPSLHRRGWLGGATGWLP